MTGHSLKFNQVVIPVAAALYVVSLNEQVSTSSGV